MFQNPSVVLYACVSRRNPTAILADFNPENDPDIEASAVRCLQNTPPYHSTFSHTNDDKTYAYLIHGENDDESPVVFFGIFDAARITEAEQGTPLQFLNLVKDKLDTIVAGKMKIRADRALQSAADELFREPLGLHERGAKGMCSRFFGLAMCVVHWDKKLMKKKMKMMKKKMKMMKKQGAAVGKERSFGSDENSDCGLVSSSET